MKLFIAGQGVPKKDIYSFRLKQQQEGREIAFLHSYLEIKNGDYDLLTKYLSPENIFLDSGAFTAFTQGTVIDIDHYIMTIKKLNIPQYAVLDVIGDYVKTAENLAYMESKGLRPIPTFHNGSPLEELHKLLQSDYEYIALGGLVPLATNRRALQAWLDKCFKIITSYPKIKKVHLFGINSTWCWFRYPIYSADATSWVSGSKFRRIVVFNAERGKMETHHKGIDTHMSQKVWNGNYVDLNLHNIAEYTRAADYATELWKKRGVTWDSN